MESSKAETIIITYLEGRLTVLQDELTNQNREIQMQMDSIKSWVVAAAILGFGVQLGIILHSLVH